MTNKLVSLVSTLGITMSVQRIGHADEDTVLVDESGWKHRAYHCVLSGRKNGKPTLLSTMFRVGTAVNFGTNPRSVADVLASLNSDSQVNESSFEDFCSDMGLNSDSRKAKKTYKACKQAARNLRAFLAPDDLERLKEACQDY